MPVIISLRRRQQVEMEVPKYANVLSTLFTNELHFQCAAGPQHRFRSGPMPFCPARVTVKSS
ncbi:hypothetical protein JG687_00010024 [Phytophthora cactorum]|uniref:Uncharacterized protein n=1 Tax=Phytophthora cactorum TaxID=29920 RepID=A0A8T1UDF6_9STRA|nr:hypothetical protein JG687_00010024 [Phytophthora cactorum]